MTNLYVERASVPTSWIRNLIYESSKKYLAPGSMAEAILERGEADFFVRP